MAANTIEDTLGDLRDSIDRLQADLRRQARAAGSTIAKDGTQVAKHAKAAGRAAYAAGTEQANGWLTAGKRLRETAAEGSSDAAEHFRVLTDRAKESLSDVATYADGGSRKGISETRRFVRDRPLASLFLALAAGWAISRVLERD